MGRRKKQWDPEIPLVSDSGGSAGEGGRRSTASAESIMVFLINRLPVKDLGFSRFSMPPRWCEVGSGLFAGSMEVRPRSEENRRTGRWAGEGWAARRNPWQGVSRRGDSWAPPSRDLVGVWRDPAAVDEALDDPGWRDGWLAGGAMERLSRLGALQEMEQGAVSLVESGPDQRAESAAAPDGFYCGKFRARARAETSARAAGAGKPPITTPLSSRKVTSAKVFTNKSCPHPGSAPYFPGLRQSSDFLRRQFEQVRPSAMDMAAPPPHRHLFKQPPPHQPGGEGGGVRTTSPLLVIKELSSNHAGTRLGKEPFFNAGWPSGNIVFGSKPLDLSSASVGDVQPPLPEAPGDVLLALLMNLRACLTLQHHAVSVKTNRVPRAAQTFPAGLRGRSFRAAPSRSAARTDGGPLPGVAIKRRPAAGERVRHSRRGGDALAHHLLGIAEGGESRRWR
jgi:hypothetical protein